jgi:hypothetical protein
MNDTLDMSKKFTEFFYSADSPKHGKVLVVSKYTERTRINICLLKFFLHEMKQKGIFITVDRPHQYTASLLTIHGISQENLVYIDAISRISGEVEANVSNVKFINGPQDMNFLDDITSISYAAGAVKTQSIDLKDMDFILIDDIAALTKYQEMDGVKKMIDSYMSSVERLKDIVAPIVLDANRNRKIYEIITQRCDRFLFINLSKVIFKEMKKPIVARRVSPLTAIVPAGLVPAPTGG